MADKIYAMGHSSKLVAYLLCAALLTSPVVLCAESKNPEDYPLRLHIFSREEHNPYHRGVEDFSKGEGRANLFANGEVHGVDFSFECGEKVKSSLGFETYMAKWKKPGKQVVVLLPVFGKAGSFEPCTFDVDVKDIAYYSHDHDILTESPEAFKAWMVAHNYDPEHGKNDPVYPAAPPKSGASPSALAPLLTAPPPPPPSSPPPPPSTE